MKALITGGAGFIGSHLSEALLKKGYKVNVLDNLSTGNLENIQHLQDEQDFSFVEGDILDESLMKSLIAEADEIYHLAAVVGMKYIMEHPLRAFHISVDGTEMVLRLASREKKKVIFTSSSDAYGLWKSDAITKAGAEAFALAYWHDENLPDSKESFFSFFRFIRSATKEIHLRTGHKLVLFRIHQLVGDGEMVAFLVGGSIEPPKNFRRSRESGRFAREWQPASMRMNLYSMEEKAKKWASYLLFFKGLPPLDAELDDRKPLASVSLANSLEEYISFRWLARRSKLQGTLRFFQLFVPEKYEDIEKVILSSIEQDRKQLENIEKEDEFVRETLACDACETPSMKNRFALKLRIGLEGEDSPSRLEALLFSTGQLLYSFSEHIHKTLRRW